MAVSDIRRRFTRGIKGRPFFVLVLILVLLAGVFLGARLGGKENKPVITGELLGQQLCFVQELATVEYRYTNMGNSTAGRCPSPPNGLLWPMTALSMRAWI